MANLKLNINEGVKVPSSIKAEVISSFNEKIPANWNIVSIGGGNIRATSKKGDFFEGPISEFNKRLRS